MSNMKNDFRSGSFGPDGNHISGYHIDRLSRKGSFNKKYASSSESEDEDEDEKADEVGQLKHIDGPGLDLEVPRLPSTGNVNLTFFKYKAFKQNMQPKLDRANSLYQSIHS